MPQHRHRHDPSKTLVGFSVGDVRYAIAIGDVREISNPLPLVPLPHAPGEVRGVADYRGEVIPVVDLRVRFGLPAIEESRRVKWVVVQVSGRSVALVVDHMLGVFGSGASGIRPAPPLGGGETERGIEGVTTNQDGLVFVVDLGAFGDITRELALPAAAASALPSASPGEPRAPKVGRR